MTALQSPALQPNLAITRGAAHVLYLLAAMAHKIYSEFPRTATNFPTAFLSGIHSSALLHPLSKHGTEKYADFSGTPFPVSCRRRPLSGCTGTPSPPGRPTA